jgi:hypothetical protein
MAGRSIRLFLVDGTPQGMRTAEVGNWTGLALVCPRTDLARLGARPEVRRSGVYILVGPSESSPSGLSVYVGEGDEVWTRLTSHDATKDFWTWVVIFVSKDDNLTKAHVRWLEATLVREIKKAKRAEVVNGNEPTGGKLPEADTADMETYFENVRFLLPTLGVNVFATEATSGGGTVPKNALRLELKSEDVRAECLVVDGQFVVTAGSTARSREAESLRSTGRGLRRQLQESGVLIPKPGSATQLVFTQDYSFDSPSGASTVVFGAENNGRASWKVTGTTESYKDWLEKQVTTAADGDADQGSP